MSAKSIAAGGLVAGLYIALTALFAPMSFGAIQFRVSEALTLLPVLSPAAVPGLFIGCFISNLILGAPWQDVVFGSLATLLAAILTRALRRRRWLAALMPVILNGLVIGGMLSILYALPFLATAATVALGEAVVCYMLGLPLAGLLHKRFGEELERR
jgi:uncharacterized membrane protein